MTFEHIPDLKELIPEVPEDSIISRRIYKDEQVDVTLFGFAAGQELTEHTSSRPAMLYFVEGKAALTLGQEVREAAPGTWVHMAPHLPHSIHALSPVTMLLVLY